MRKTYEAPLCQRIEVSEEDILTESDGFIGFDKNDDTPGNFEGGGVIHW
ncbi:MAG: hypothetical protein IJX28_04545 [Clostridia bacterium]|nr:hypothetical protein [Clostridia bacterium]